MENIKIEVNEELLDRIMKYVIVNKSEKGHKFINIAVDVKKFIEDLQNEMLP